MLQCFSQFFVQNREKSPITIPERYFSIYHVPNFHSQYEGNLCKVINTYSPYNQNNIGFLMVLGGIDGFELLRINPHKS